MHRNIQQRFQAAIEFALALLHTMYYIITLLVRAIKATSGFNLLST